MPPNESLPRISVPPKLLLSQGLTPFSGLSPSMTLLPGTLVDETNEPRASQALRSPPPPRQVGGSPLLRPGPTARPATASPLALDTLAGLPLAAPTGRQYRDRLSAVPCRSRRPGSRHLCAGHHLNNTPGQPPGSSQGPLDTLVLMPTADVTTPQTVNPPRRAGFQRNAFPVPA
jgi:hypothetical protein